MVNIFPNIILNGVDYGDVNIQHYYGFSNNHVTKLKAYISGYYEKLKRFDNTPMLKNILTTIQKTSKNLVFIANNTPSFTSIKLNDGKTIKPVFDERTSRHLFEYYLLRVLINYIDLTDDDEMAVTESIKENMVDYIVANEYIGDAETRNQINVTSRKQSDTTLLTGNQKQLRQITAELLTVFINILHNQKDAVDTSYEEIQDRIFKLREKEKGGVTDRLKKMTDNQREVDTILKINKLGMYNKGLQKGLTTYDWEYYDEEQTLRDTMVQMERRIRDKNQDANDNNIDILLEERLEEMQNADGIENDAFDMRHLGETYYDGNADGAEVEYDDY
jgi:hypothetical protein